MLVGVLLAVGSEKVVPLGFELRTTSGNVPVGFVGLFGDIEGFVSREFELGLQRCDIIGLKSWWRGRYQWA